jgi:hypothetical protein
MAIGGHQTRLVRLQGEEHAVQRVSVLVVRDGEARLLERGRRMSELAAHLVDRVIPYVPVRQWVLSLPWSLRYQLAFDARLCRDVLAVFLRVVFGWLRRAARREGVPTASAAP